MKNFLKQFRCNWTVCKQLDNISISFIFMPRHWAKATSTKTRVYFLAVAKSQSKMKNWWYLPRAEKKYTRLVEIEIWIIYKVMASTEASATQHRRIDCPPQFIIYIEIISRVSYLSIKQKLKVYLKIITVWYLVWKNHRPLFILQFFILLMIRIRFGILWKTSRLKTLFQDLKIKISIFFLLISDLIVLSPPQKKKKWTESWQRIELLAKCRPILMSRSIYVFCAT